MRASDHKSVRFSESVRSKVYLRREGGLEKGISFTDVLSCDYFTRRDKLSSQAFLIQDPQLDWLDETMRRVSMGIFTVVWNSARR